MSNFKDFVNSSHKNEIIKLSSSQELATMISSSLTVSTLSITALDSKKFGDEVVKIAYGDEVLTELSQAIGDPKETESEDEFVERAKSTLSKILKRKFIK